jgi:Fic family protein
MNNRFGYRKSGEYRFVEKRNGLPAHTTFIPNPLSEDIEIEVDTELVNLISKANGLLGQLEGMSAFLPNATAIESIFMYKEALLSCQIDGIYTPMYNILDISRKDYTNARIIQDYISAMKYGLDKISVSKYKNVLLCEMHKALVRPSEDANCGRFRKEQIFLSSAITNVEQYNPTAPHDISLTMCDLESFIQRKDNFDATIKAALAHYQFETIHPFMTGNGGIGRILSYLILSNMKVLTRPILCLSQYLYYNKVDYIDRMERLRRVYDCEQWVKFFIQSITFAAADSLENIKDWSVVREANLNKIKSCGKTIKAIEKTFDIIELYPIIDVNTLAEKAGISYNTAAATLKLLCDLKIMGQSNELERNRDYANIGFLKCFVSDIERH